MVVDEKTEFISFDLFVFMIIFERNNFERKTYQNSCNNKDENYKG